MVARPLARTASSAAEAAGASVGETASASARSACAASSVSLNWRFSALSR